MVSVALAAASVQCTTLSGHTCGIRAGYKGTRISARSALAIKYCHSAPDASAWPGGDFLRFEHFPIGKYKGKSAGGGKFLNFQLFSLGKHKGASCVGQFDTFLEFMECGEFSDGGRNSEV